MGESRLMRIPESLEEEFEREKEKKRFSTFQEFLKDKKRKADKFERIEERFIESIGVDAEGVDDDQLFPLG